MSISQRRRTRWYWLAGLLLLAGVLLAATYGYRLSQPLWSPSDRALSRLKAVRAVRVDYVDFRQSRAQVAALETQMKQAGVNLVAVGAGREDWTYFAWAGHQDSWSAEVRTSGVDYLADDSRRFGQWAHVTAVVDVLAPLYVQADPEAAAVSWTGVPSQNLVGTMELVEGDFGQRLLAMIDAVSGSYPVNSVSISEVFYHTDGYGDRDKAAYMGYTGRTDWPRTTAGTINPDDPSVGTWRSYEVSRFVEKAAAVVHKHGKLLFVEVHINPDNYNELTALDGTRYDLMLKYADRLVVWGNYGLDPSAPARMREIGQFLSTYGSDRVIMLLGLWQQDEQAAQTNKDQQAPISAADLKAELELAQQGGMDNVWITPSYLLSADHWAVLKTAWSAAP